MPSWCSLCMLAVGDRDCWRCPREGKSHHRFHHDCRDEILRTLDLTGLWISESFLFFFILLMILYFIFSYFIFQYVESSCWYVACLYSCICASSWMYPCSLLVSCSVQDSMEMRSTDTWTAGSLSNAIVCALTFSIINNQLFLVLCFDVLMFCLFVLFFFLVLFICSIFSHLHIIMYDREIIFIFCYFVDVNFHHNVCAFFHLKFGILEFLISKVYLYYLYCLFMLLHLAFALCAPQVPFVCLYGYAWALHGGLAIRGGGGEPWVQKGLWLWSVSDQMCILSFYILIFCNLFINS